MANQDTDQVSVKCAYCCRQATRVLDTASGMYPTCDRHQQQYRVIAYRILRLTEYLEREA